VYREASILRPNSPAFSIALALSLLYRFDETLTNDDFEEATTILNGINWFPKSRKFARFMATIIVVYD